MKKILIMVSMAALLAGCYTADRRYYNEPVGGTAAYDGTYHYYGHGYGIVPPPMNTNSAYYPVNSGAEAAWGPGTPSGGALWQVR
jgi:hypothetical protein